MALALLAARTHCLGRIWRVHVLIKQEAVGVQLEDTKEQDVMVSTQIRTESRYEQRAIDHTLEWETDGIF